MLTHKEKYLSGYLDRELNPNQRDAVERHILGCRKCAGELENLKKIKSVVNGYSAYSAPTGGLPMSLVYGHKKLVASKMPVYETVGYKLGLAVFMNVFMLKVENFSRAWLLILGAYALFHLILYIRLNVRRVREVGIA